MAIKVGETIPRPIFDKIPYELKQHKRWLLWQSRPRKDKLEEATKVPVNLEGKSFYGWNNVNNLYSFEEVEMAFQKGGFDGIGFSLINTDLICIDLDNNFSTEDISEELRRLVTCSYSEISPSGKGYHIWVKGKKPNGMGKNGYTAADEKIEVFGNSGWVTVTGNVCHSDLIRKNQRLIENIYQAYFYKGNRYTSEMVDKKTIVDIEKVKLDMFSGSDGNKIRALWNGDIREFHGDHSRADFALCRYLVRYVGKDVAAVDTLFRQSGLYRKKWDERRGNSTYGERTIVNAINLESREIGISNNSDIMNKVDSEEIVDDLLKVNQEIKLLLMKYIKMQEKVNRSLIEKLERQERMLRCRT